LQVVLSDGEQQVELAFEPLTVASVIKPQPGQTPQPYGPFGPFAMSWPLYYWWILAGLCVALLSTVLTQ
jgi:hypothetical protein